MRELFEITSSDGTYPVRLSGEPLRSVVECSDSDIVLADEFFRDALDGLAKPVIFVAAEETSKDMVNVAPLIEQIRRAGLTRDGVILAVGGGVIQDIACFIASVYMRGVRWTYVPTTLLAMVDSCIGGTSSINIGDFKNLVGTFYPPKAILIVPEVIATLPDEHIAAGRAEAAKICFARGEGAFDDYLELDGTFASDAGPLIAHSLSTKKWFIETDEFDRNERLLLNFGHSFGHALESCSAYAVPHGVAVGVGCLAAIQLSSMRESGLEKHPGALALSNQMRTILAPVEGLNNALAEVEREHFFRFWDSDKKHAPDTYRPILLGDDARLYRASLPRGPDITNAIWSAFVAARASLKDEPASLATSS
jgi:3-dehydroquinate synthase